MPTTATNPATTSTEIVHRSCPICEASCGLRAEIDRTAKKGIIHERTASRYKSRLAKAHQRMAGGAQS